MTDGPEASAAESCNDCGGVVRLAWHAPDDLFRTVTGQRWERAEDGRWYFVRDDQRIYEGDEPTIGVLCPDCFDSRAAALGIFIRWEAEANDPRPYVKDPRDHDQAGSEW